MKSNIRLIVMAWSIGLLGGLFLWFLRITTRVKVQGYSRSKFDPKGKGLILVHNHSSLWEPALFPFLFSPWYLFSLRFVPFSTPDKINYYDKWWFSFFRAVCIPIERGNLKGEVRALKEMKDRLADGKILILAPEGGRTFKGEEFKVIRRGKIEVVRRGTPGVRHSKLYYVRGKSPREVDEIFSHAVRRIEGVTPKKAKKAKRKTSK